MGGWEENVINVCGIHTLLGKKAAHFLLHYDSRTGTALFLLGIWTLGARWVIRRGADAYARGKTEELLEQQTVRYHEDSVKTAAEQRNVVPSHTVLNVNGKITLRREN